MNNLELLDIIKQIKKLDQNDWEIIGSIIIKTEELKQPIITQTSKGTYFDFKLFKVETIKNIKYFLKIKDENDKIDTMKKEF